MPAFVAGGLLFLGGATFCYYIILPQTLQFFLDFNDWFGWSADWPIDRYIDFVLQMLIAFGVSFELPLLVIILALIGVIDYAFLKYYRRHMIVFLVVFAACVTPTSDPFNLFMLFGPMYFLYEISVFIVHLIGKGKSDGVEIVDVHHSDMK
jgi:sec-independent protein translocase protein TatC